MKKTIIDLFENSVKQYPDKSFPVGKNQGCLRTDHLQGSSATSLYCRCRTNRSRSEEGRQYGTPFGRP